MATLHWGRSAFIAVLLLFVVSAVSAKVDTLGYIGKRSKGDTTFSTSFMNKVTWYVCATFTDGTKDTCLISQPDSALVLDHLSSLHMTATFYVDTPARNKLLYLHAVLEGAATISMNGRNVLTTGSLEKDWIFSNPERDEYASIVFSDSVSRIDIEYIPYKTGDFSLDLALYQQHAGDKKIKQGVSDNKEAIATGFYYLAFFIVFLLLFVFFREQTENLYFSMFCFFAAMYYLWGQLETGLLYNLDAFFGIYCFEFLSIFFSKILANREQSKKPLFVITCLLAMCFLPPVRYSTFHIFGQSVSWVLVAVIASLYCYTWIKTVIVLVRGVGQKRWEARAVIVFCLVPIVIYIVVSIVASFAFVAEVGKNENSARGTVSAAQAFRNLLGYFTTAIIFLYPLAAVVILGRRNGMNQIRLIAQVKSIRELSEENLAREVEKKEILEHQNEVLEKEVALRTEEVVAQKEEIEKQHEALKLEKNKSDDLLRNILPQEVADELKAKGTTTAHHYDNVSVLFTDFVNFTKAGERMSPQGLIDELHACFKAFDDITGKFGIEKIKTIGDAYLAVCGLPTPDANHGENIVKAAIEINAFMAHRMEQLGSERTFRIRIGIHSGSVVAGIVGVKKFAYDIWGDTVNTAARMEQHGEAGKINISETTYELVKNKFSCEYRGEVEAKGKGVMKMYFVKT